jgi:hypothetical protein
MGMGLYGTRMGLAFSIRRFQQIWQAIPAWRVLLLAVAGTTAALGQVLTNTSDSNLVAVVAMGSLTPANTSTTASGQMQLRLRSKNANPNGYRLDAVATFTPGAAATVNGGDTIAATDIGIGITSITPAPNVDLPRADSILFGFNYDPSTVSATDGLTPYTNAAGGKATLADLLTSKKILSGNKIAQNEPIGNPNNYLQVTLTFGVLPQYFSPSSFSAVITLTLSNGP